MGVPLGDLQIGPQARQVQRGGGLADAAADLVHGLALDVGGGGLVASCGGPLAHGLVIGEGLPGVEHILVDGGGGELHVGLAGGGAAHLGLGGAQHVPEQQVLQRLGGDGGLLYLGGDGDGLAGLRRVQGDLGGGHVEVRAHLLRDDGVGLGVVGGVLHLAGGLVVDLLDGQGLGGDGGEGDIELDGGTVKLRQILAQGVLAHRAAVPGLGDGDAVLAQLVGGVHRLLVQTVRQIRHGGFYIAAELEAKPHAVPPDQAAEIGKALDKKGHPALAVQRLLRPVGEGNTDALTGRLRSKAQLGQGQDEERLLVLRPVRIGAVRGLIDGDLPLRQLLRQFFLGLGRGQPAHVNAVDLITLKKGIQRTGPGAKAYVGGDQYRQNCARYDQRPFAALFQPFRRHGLCGVLHHDAPPVAGN